MVIWLIPISLTVYQHSVMWYWLSLTIAYVDTIFIFIFLQHSQDILIHSIFEEHWIIITLFIQLHLLLIYTFLQYFSDYLFIPTLLMQFNYIFVIIIIPMTIIYSILCCLWTIFIPTNIIYLMKLQYLNSICVYEQYFIKFHSKIFNNIYWLHKVEECLFIFTLFIQLYSIWTFRFLFSYLGYFCLYSNFLCRWSDKSGKKVPICCKHSCCRSNWTFLEYLLSVFVAKHNSLREANTFYYRKQHF